MRLRMLAMAGAGCAGLVWGVGCGDGGDGGPPEVRYGDSVCAECNMIISDERFATATIVEGDRGPEARVFDDFNCQIRHETAAPELVVLSRWVHDHGTRAWVDAERAHYVRSARLSTPMASNLAAFAANADAEAMAATLMGEVLGFEGMWKGEVLDGCCSAGDDGSGNGAGKESDDAVGG